MDTASPSYSNNDIADALIDVRRAWITGSPEEVFAAWGLSADDALEVISHIPTTDLEQEQALAIGILVGLRLAEIAAS